jgi:CheY-like chemotaxis protein
MGAVGFMAKPVEAMQLRSALRALEEAGRAGVRKVLLVESDATLRASMQALLVGSEFVVDAVGTPGEAAARIAATTYGCVIANLALPDPAAGFELLAKIRAVPRTAHVPVVVHTATTPTVGELRALEEDPRVIVVMDGERSSERVLEETRLFVHRVRTALPERGSGATPPAGIETILDGKTVLVVDDDMRNVYSLSSALRAKNLRVLTATDGQEALDELAQHPETSAVLMDIMMPRMDGHEATRRIRAQDKFRELPIIALTAKTMNGERERCLEAGASDYVPKPVDVDRLVALLRRWLGDRAGSDTSAAATRAP